MTGEPARVVHLHRRTVARPDAPVGVLAPPPLGLYVHLPWCVRKCPYCDFNSHELRGGGADLPEEDYLRALETDLDTSLPFVWGRTVQTVFIGGGTPSLFSEASIDRLIAMIRARLRLAADAEITMEANPGTFEMERFRGFARAGVNRLSLGIQSFSDRALATIGRIHDGSAARTALAAAQAIFPRVNADLIYALPGQTLEELEHDLAQVAAIGCTHLSAYQLTLEEGTLFARRPPALPDDGMADAMQDLIDQRAGEWGLCRYEVSAMARRGDECRHNLNYWQFGDYLGIGAGAHGKLSFHDRIIRQARVRSPKRYMEELLKERPVAMAFAGPGDESIRAPWIETSAVVPAGDLPFEFMLNALRLREGVPSGLFAERTGMTLDQMAEPIGQAVQRGLLIDHPSRLQATEQGWRYLNDLQAIFLKD